MEWQFVLLPGPGPPVDHTACMVHVHFLLRSSWDELSGPFSEESWSYFRGPFCSHSADMDSVKFYFLCPEVISSSIPSGCSHGLCETPYYIPSSILQCCLCHTLKKKRYFGKVRHSLLNSGISEPEHHNQTSLTGPKGDRRSGATLCRSSWFAPAWLALRSMDTNPSAPVGPGATLCSQVQSTPAAQS